MLIGNKGQWSELYVLISLLAEGKLHQADFNLNKDPNNIYDVIKGYKSETNYRLEFDRKNKIKLFKITDDSKKEITSISLSQFHKLAEDLYAGIKSGKNRAFRIPHIEKELDNLLIQNVAAFASSKADIQLRIYDHRLAKETDLGFSIKSLLGGDSTLLNTGKGNNFIYKVKNISISSISDFNKFTYKPSGGISKLTFRLQELENAGANIIFHKIQSFQLWKNLKMVDGDLPDILAYALLYRWKDRENSLKGVANLLELRDPLNYYNNEISKQKLYEYKLKNLLAESAMGMTSETPWMGEYDKFGGVIIAKEDGDIVCFHIYDFNLFRNYLLENTVFEQAATGEDPINPGNSKPNAKKKYYYGWLLEEEDDLLFKINLQIRFK